jgi:hypothetical protein
VRARQDLTPAERAELLLGPTLTEPDTARVLGVGTTALRDALRKGQLDLPVIRVGTRKVIPSAAPRRLLGIEDGAAELDRGPS